MTQHDPDQEERALLDAYEAGDFRTDMDADRRRQLVEAAKASTRKDKHMNIRIASRDLKALQRRAMEEGLPYQSLVASIDEQIKDAAERHNAFLQELGQPPL